MKKHPKAESIETKSYPCITRERDPGAPCGATWIQFTKNDQTIGACGRTVLVDGIPRIEPFAAGETFVGRVTTDTAAGTVLYELVDGDGVPVAALVDAPPLEP